MTAHLLPPEVSALAPYVDAGVFGVTEVQIVASLIRSAGDVACDDDVVVALALAVRAPLHGHVRAELDGIAASVVPHAEPVPSAVPLGLGPDEVSDEGPEDPAAMLLDAPDGDTIPTDVSSLHWPEPTGWMASLLESPLVRAEDDPEGTRRTPLVAGESVLYLDRLHRDEVRAAELLRRRASRSPVGIPPGSRRAVDRLFPPGPDGPTAQHRAATVALERDLVVVAGGPGTGKTRTIARLAAALMGEDAQERVPEVVLAAPTGKAAARLTESVRREASEVEVDPVVRDRLAGLTAVTLHRLLGMRPSGTARHDADNPLTADVVVVDEMSMVDLPMAARLFAAVRDDAKLVLVGDPSQLASVEAGAVLGDLVGSRGRPTPTALAPNIVVLDRVHRFGTDSPIGALARRIDAGDADGTLGVLRGGGVGSGEHVRLLDPEDSDAVDAVIGSVLERGRRLVASARAGDAAATLSELASLQVLAATVRGPLGVSDWNQRIDRALSSEGLLRGRWSPGRPVMITANDQLNRVFNGDVGVVVVDGERDGRPRVAFAGAEGIRLLDPSRLDRHERLWAMTIHKSQGSEYSDVVVTLPPPPSPILTRELLYTAVTRARRGVTVIASDASVRAAVDRPVARSSGLAARLS